MGKIWVDYYNTHALIYLLPKIKVRNKFQGIWVDRTLEKQNPNMLLIQYCTISAQVSDPTS